MRIIGGKFKGRKFNPPADNWPTRPTTDYAKEGLFNILNNEFDFEDLKALDLYGGTGNHAYELISRGCLDVTYVDKFRPAALFVQKIAETLEIQSLLHIKVLDVFLFLDRTFDKFDYIIADPPYEMPSLDQIPDRVFARGLLREGGWLVVEHTFNNDFKSHPNYFQERHYSKTIFSFFRNIVTQTNEELLESEK